MRSSATGLSTDNAAGAPPPDHATSSKTKLFAVGRFFLFVLIMGAFLVSFRLLLSKLPHVGALLKSADAGELSPSLTWIVDSIGFSAVLLYCAVARRIERRSAGVYGLSTRGPFGKLFVQGVLWGLALAFLDIAITWLLGGYSFGSIALGSSDVIRYGLAWGGAFLLVGLLEESLFRGYPLYTLSLGIGFWPAATLLALLFAGLHLTNAGESVIGALDVAIYALFASLTLRRTGSLWFAVGIHAAWDFSLTFLYSVPGSGLNARGVLLHSAMHGKTWLTGGSAGPEGSAIGLGVLLLAVVVFPRAMPQRT
ncbi:MAG TPA: CPBP family intramembrane glutamic endopeptidase [Candidatus Sulfotelmatobacter sp.]|nr:CPBP family intramembrane glutamic endopeptidase [Candidatus Sulfotelmatobacter sp.]